MKVKKEMIEGLYSFKSFYKLVELCLHELNIPIQQRSAALNWYGFYIGKGEKDIFIGIYLESPEYLIVQNEDGEIKSDYQSGSTEVTLGELNKSRESWEAKLNLLEGNVYVDDILSFLSESVWYAHSILKKPSF